MSNGTSPANAAIVESSNNGAFQFKINGSVVHTCTNWNQFFAGNPGMVTITNTGNGNCHFNITTPHDPPIKLTDNFNYTGGALNVNGIVSPWAYVHELVGNREEKDILIDYIAIRYFAIRGENNPW